MDPAASSICNGNRPSAQPTCTKSAKSCQAESGWRKLIRNFTPSWFSVNMGTGVVSILLHNLPYNGRWLQYISYILFALNVLLFAVFLLVTILRYSLYPRIWGAMIRHPTQSLFIGTFPMGLATIINMIAFVCVPAWGGAWWKLAWALWWFDAAVAVACCFGLPFILMAEHKQTIGSMTAAWLLPVVSTIVAAATGGIVAERIPLATHSNEALITILTSYVLWGTGVPLAMCILVIYFLRITTARLPPREVIVSTFLPLGPLGQGGFGIQQLGKVSMSVFADRKTLPMSTDPGNVLYILGFFVGLVMWGFGLVWLGFAVASVVRSQRFPFNMGWWGCTFPLGVFTLCTTTLGEDIPSAFFRVLGTILSIVVTLLWIVVAIGTARKAITGELFYAPCLKDLEHEHARSSPECATRLNERQKGSTV